MAVRERYIELDLPRGQALVFGGSAMELFGLREARDIDILVTNDVFDKLYATGDWEYREIRPGDMVLSRDGIEVYNNLAHERFHPNHEKIFERAIDIGGVLTMCVDDLIAFKESLGREKDLKDIQLLKDYEKMGKS